MTNMSSLHGHAEWQASGEAPAAHTVIQRDASNESASFDPDCTECSSSDLAPLLFSDISRGEDRSAEESKYNIGDGHVPVGAAAIGRSERHHTSTPRAKVERKVRRSPRVSAMERDKASTLVNPASHFHASPIDSSVVGRTLLPTITPHVEHDASLAHAGLHPAKSTLLGDNDPTTFPELLHTMVTHLTDTQPDLVHWTHDGKAFTVRDPKDPRLEDILMWYFGHRNYKSLHRQLNVYGWIKIKEGMNAGAFYNEAFHRDSSPSELSSITRKGQRTSKAASRVKKRSQQQDDREVLGTVENSMDAAGTVKEDAYDSVSKNVVAKPDGKQESTTKTVTVTTKVGPAKKRFKGEALIHETSPLVSRTVTGATHDDSFVSESMEREIPASPTIAFEGISFMPEDDVDETTPLVSRTITDSFDSMDGEIPSSPISLDGVSFSPEDEEPVDETTPLVSRTITGATHHDSFLSQPKEGELPAVPVAFEGISFAPEDLDWLEAVRKRHESGGRIRMTLYDGKPAQTTSPIPPLDFLVPFGGIDAPISLPPSPIFPRRPEEHLPPALLRNASSNECSPSPVPLERYSSSESAFLRPFDGMTTELASALACEESFLTPSLGGFEAGIGNQALFF